jgi:gluconolactonase
MGNILSKPFHASCRRTRLKAGIAMAVMILFLTVVSINAQIMDNTNIIAEGAGLELLGEGFNLPRDRHLMPKAMFTLLISQTIPLSKWDWATGEFSVFMEDAGRSNGMYFDIMDI